MRPDMIDSSSPYNMNQESPKASNIWSTERRLLERPPPCRPQKSGRRTSLSSHLCEQDNYEASTKKQRNDRLLLPSRTINEDDEFPHIALSFRQTNLTTMFNSAASEISSDSLHHQDPTTVLLIPEMSPLPWYSNDDDENDDDMILSPRLFRFGQQLHNDSCFASIDLADDDTSFNNNTFRELYSDEDGDDDNNNDSVESRDIFSNDETIQRRYTWANTASGFPFETMPSEDDDDDRN